MKKADFINADTVMSGALEADAIYWGDELLWSNYPAVLDEAVLWLDSQYSGSGEPRARNQGTGGTALDAKYGSVLGAYVYDGAAVLPGVAGNYLSVPDAAALDITGDLCIIARATPADWTPASVNNLAAKWNTTGNQRSFYLRLESGGVRLGWSTTGAEEVTRISTSGVSFADGTEGWVAATFDVDNGAAGHSVRFWTSTDGATWTQLGSTVTTAGVTSIFAGTAALEVGSQNAGGSSPLTGSVGRVILNSGFGASGEVGGATVLDVDCANAPDYATSFTATTGQTVTVNSTSADTNDPLLLTHTGENYAYLPGGSTGSTIKVAQDAPMLLTGARTLAVRCAITWSDNGFLALLGRATSNVGFDFRQVGGSLRFLSGTGTAYSEVIATVDTDTLLSDDQAYWVKVDYIPNTGAGQYSCEFYYAPDQTNYPTSWTKIGATVTGASTTQTTAAGDAGIGAFGTGTTPTGGKWYRAMMFDGIDGTTVFDFNAATDITDAGATSFTATSGQTVTVNRATSGRKTALVTRPIWLFGTDDYLEVADNALVEVGADDFTALAVVRTFGTGANPVVLSKASGDGATMTGWTIQQNAFGLQSNRVGDGTTRLTPGDGGAWAAGDLHVNALVRGGGNFTSYFDDATPVSVTDTIGNLNHVTTLKVGAIGATAQFLAGEIVAVAVWRRALTADEIAAINAFYGTA